MSVEPITNGKHVLKLELHADEHNRCLLCKFPDSHAVTRTTTVGQGNFYSSSGDTVIHGNENAINVRVTPELAADVYSNQALLNFCKKNIDCNIEDAVLLSKDGFAEFDMIGYTAKDIAWQILLCPCICLLAFVAVAGGDPHMLDSCRKNIWRWKEKKMATSKEEGSFVDYKFVLISEGQ